MKEEEIQALLLFPEFAKEIHSRDEDSIKKFKIKLEELR
jgi:hypothetical protein